MANDKTDTPPVATPVPSETRKSSSRAETATPSDKAARDEGGRSWVYRASPPGRLEAHEATIERMDADTDFTFDIVLYRAHVEYARAEVDRENWPEARAHIAAADTQLTRMAWILDDDRNTGAKQRKHLGELRESQNEAAQKGVQERRDAISALLCETHLTGGALDKWLKKQLLQRYGMAISARSIRGDRKALSS